ncbi:MAG: serine hydrolase, partial [Cyanobacteriota bacterium]|nr:serine hydrolase [Cyanobacteriota bacterium]
MSSSRPYRNRSNGAGPLRLLLRLILMGIGLGVITGSALKMLGPQVKQGKLDLPEWLPWRNWISVKGIPSRFNIVEEATNPMLSNGNSLQLG